MQWFQQGDVLIKPVRKVPRMAKRLKMSILAQGEASGHHHSASGENVTTWIAQGMIFLDAPNGAKVCHEEHLPIEVPPGVYKIEIVREYDHFSDEVHEVLD